MSKFMDSTKIFFQKNSPTILLVGGTVLVLGATVFACVKTRKLDDTLKDSKEQLDQLHQIKKDAEEMTEEGKELAVYSESGYRKDIAKVYLNAGLKVGKLYAIPLVIGAVGFAMIFESHSIMGERYSSAVAACMATERIFNFYRKNVVDELGEEADARFRHGLRKETVERPVFDDEGNPKVDKEGKPKTKKEEVMVPKDEDATMAYSPYARVFAKHCPYIQIGKGQDYGSREWEDSGFYNLKFVQEIEDETERKLQRVGYVFLNDVYERLGFDRSPEGQDVGWKIDPDDPLSDNHVKFTILPKGANPDSDEVQAMLKGETDFIIDFNVCGNIKPFIWGDSKKTFPFPKSPFARD